MKIKSISIENIKSFNSTFELEFSGDYNIIIGPNASGKSNLLDVITVCIRKYFLWSYSLTSDYGSTRKKLDKRSSFENVNNVLAKFNGNSSPSLIRFTFFVEETDIENLEIIQENIDEFGRFLNESGGGSIQISDLEASFRKVTELQVGDVISYEIINGQLKLPQNNFHTQEGSSKELLFHKYLNIYDAFSIFLVEAGSDTQLNPVFLFLSAYRAANEGQGFQGVLSQGTSRLAFLNLSGTTSKSATSLINIASLYFAEKMRKYESQATDVGYKERWNKDSENILITKYLERMGYKWDLKLINPSNNTYEIQLEKEGNSLMLSQASSGEKEIINYLFGIFALKIKSGLIIVDEPELHLHPRWQRLLLELFIELSLVTGNQFVISTHSPVFIQGKTLKNLVRIFKLQNESRCVSLKDDPVDNLKSLLHIVNSTNNEKMFFADAVVLVEGITDRIVFQRLIDKELEREKKLSIIEVIDINGKSNISKFREFLDKLSVPSFFIADLDFVTDIGNSTLKDLFVVNKDKITKQVFTNQTSLDREKLIDVLESSIENNDLTGLKDFVSYIKSFRQKLKEDLTEGEERMLREAIVEQKKENNFILPKGDIEDYFPEGYKAKDLDNVLKLLEKEDMSVWRDLEKLGLSELEAIIKEIVTMALSE